MEYKVNEQSGKVVWYNLVGGDGIPKKVSLDYVSL
jgi:hypothetical protein